MEEKAIEIVATKDLERSSNAGLALQQQLVGDPERALELATRQVEFLKKITMTSLKLTSVHDWVDQSGKPYLQSTGAEKLCPLWGIYFRDIKMSVAYDDDTGKPAYTYTGVVGSHAVAKALGIVSYETEAMGGRNATDDFFARQKQTDPLDVQKAAYSNFEVNAVTRLLGLRGMTWEEVSDATSGRITQETCTGKVQYKTKPKEDQREQQPSSAVISEGQRKRLYAIWKEVGWKDEEVHKFIEAKYGFKSSKDITRDKYEEIVQAIQGGTNGR